MVFSFQKSLVCASGERLPSSSDYHKKKSKRVRRERKRVFSSSCSFIYFFSFGICWNVIDLHRKDLSVVKSIFGFSSEGRNKNFLYLSLSPLNVVYTSSSFWCECSSSSSAGASSASSSTILFDPFRFDSLSRCFAIT